MAFCGTMLAACGGASFNSGALDRAAFDLSCSRDQLTPQTIVDAINIAGQPMQGAQVGVRGCGKKATYVFSDNHSWTLNSPVQPE